MAIDQCEPQIIRALEKDGWRIDEKPFIMRRRERTVFADFSVRRIIDNEIEHIVVLEVKCFTNPDADLQEFYGAVGQYAYYRSAMAVKDVMDLLYLAIPQTAYQRLIADPAVIMTIQRAEMNLLVVQTEIEEIVAWHHWQKS